MLSGYIMAQVFMPILSIEWSIGNNSETVCMEEYLIAYRSRDRRGLIKTVGWIKIDN